MAERGPTAEDEGAHGREKQRSHGGGGGRVRLLAPCSERSLSIASLGRSSSTKMRSKRESRLGGNLRFSL